MPAAVVLYLRNPDSRTHAQKCDEFWLHVLNPIKEELVLAGHARELGITSPVIEDLIDKWPDDAAQRPAYVARFLETKPSFLDDVRLLVGKTETKLRFDLSLLLRTTPGAVEGRGFCGCKPTEFVPHSLSAMQKLVGAKGGQAASAARLAVAQYLLAGGLADVVDAFKALPKEKRAAILTHAVLPHDNRQSDAKRGGHTFEASVARVLKQAGARIEPADKDTNPIAGDVAFNGRSYDVLVRDTKGNVRMAIIGLVHTSNPGQYGVDKSDQTRRYREDADAWNASHPSEEKYEVWALADGAGFGMNSAALANVLAPVHGFGQLASLFKFVARAHQLGLVKVREYYVNPTIPYDAQALAEFALGFPGATARTTPFPAGTTGLVKAGFCTLRV